MFARNSILLDKDSLRFKLNDRTKGKMRLYLGELDDDQFKQTVESIKFLDEEAARVIRKELRFLVTEVINPKKKKRLTEEERYLKSLKAWQEKHDREKAEMKQRIKYFNPDFLL